MARIKSCPSCNRTYGDEAITFCLVDGSILSAPYDPQQTLLLPKEEKSNLESTKGYAPILEKTIPALNSAPLSQPQRNEKRTSIASVFLALLVAMIAAIGGFFITHYVYPEPNLILEHQYDYNQKVEQASYIVAVITAIIAFVSCYLIVTKWNRNQ